VEQIREWSLPTRPTKQSDPRAKRFRGESVELDAIPPAKLRALVKECIERHVDRDHIERMKRIEKAERAIFTVGGQVLGRIRVL
jgi:hypothetical protein